MRGVILYEGPSRLDGHPIVAIATFGSANAKTGAMIQTWILRTDRSPMAAIHDGSDSSVCGACPLRGLVRDGVNRGRACYVNVAQAPRAVWAGWQRGIYPRYSPARHAELFRGRHIRLGSYGDPVAVPLRVWRPIVRLCAGHSGYTHQWRSLRANSAWRRYVMASVESVEGWLSARARGWRCFRARLLHQPLLPGEIVCPASAEAGHRLTCDQCLACSGGKASKASVAIVAHGGPPKMHAILAVIG